MKNQKKFLMNEEKEAVQKNKTKLRGSDLSGSNLRCAKIKTSQKDTIINSLYIIVED